ncbi:MAG TPA: hypothetical protein VH092_12560 [Urbifossiella sp.]|nr:hypothetical protein [Urbifossiella sp.]
MTTAILIGGKSRGPRCGSCSMMPRTGRTSGFYWQGEPAISLPRPKQLRADLPAFLREWVRDGRPY